jgi:hypothetical protein
VFRAVCQMDGATPLYVASQKGFLECVRMLLDRGAAIDQAMVGYSMSMARHCEGFACATPWETIRLHGNSSGAPGCHVVEAWGDRWSHDAAPMHVALKGMGSTMIVGYSTCVTEVVRPGKTTLFVTCVCRVVWQTNGTTPLYVASCNGHVECVRALLDRGAAINQTAVRYA